MGGGEEEEGREAEKQRKKGRYGHTRREAKRRLRADLLFLV